MVPKQNSDGLLKKGVFGPSFLWFDFFSCLENRKKIALSQGDFLHN